MNASIAVSNLNKKHRINERFVGEIACKVLKILKKDKRELEIIFLSDTAIKRVNGKYKHSNRATDVLSFDLGSCGEILISSDMALKNSRVFNTPLEKELILYVIHGILHLFGYDDEAPKARSKMFRKQDSILEILCANTSLSKVLTRR
ncbi:MAG: rRNA maturation RNase YbeY [Candidatus Omnitrophica bacterium]|nr:rRNA maturation RNase YbeY [Candidatus Omnitrophota bacterium]